MSQCAWMQNAAARLRSLLAVIALLLPDLAVAQASPFLTGANALQTNILAWLTPIAVILVMVLGAMAMANRMSRGDGASGQSAASQSLSARRKS
jgi:hypothetical protein